MFDDSELVHLMNSFKGNFLKVFTQDRCMLHQLILLLEHFYLKFSVISKE